MNLIRASSGEKRDDCGRVKFAKGCSNDLCETRKRPVFVYHNCHRLSCPICYHAAAGRDAKRIERRMTNLAEKYRDLGIRLGNVKHGILSVNPEDWPQERYNKHNGQDFLDMMYDVLRHYSKDGIFAGVVFAHPWRFKHHDGTECHDPDCRRDHVWAWGPHVQFVGYGYFADSRYILERTGVFVKIVQDDRHRERNILSTLAYELSHVGLWTDDAGDQIGPAYTWVGKFAFCRGGGDLLEKTLEAEICEKCESPVMQYNVKKTESGDLPRIQDLEEGSCREISKLVEWRIEIGPSMKVVETIEWYVVPRAPMRFYSLMNRNRRKWIFYWTKKGPSGWMVKPLRDRRKQGIGRWLEAFDYRLEDLALGTSDWVYVRDSQADLEGGKKIIVPADPAPRITREIEDPEDCLIFEASNDSGLLVRDPYGRRWVIPAKRDPARDLEYDHAEEGAVDQ